MAYAALVSLAQLLERMLHHDQLFYIPLSDEEPKLKSLHEKISFLQAFLDNCSHKVGERVQSLEAQIRDAAYQAQDLIEHHISDQIRSDNKCPCFWELVSTIGKMVGRSSENKFEEDLLKALEQIDSVVEEVMNIQVSCRVEEMQKSHTPALASSSRAPNETNKMVGFDKDLLELKERLCEESSRFKIIPIVGMGGIGKTTLARNLFDDSLVAYRFHTRAWVTISQEFYLHEILLGLLNSLAVNTKDLSGKPDDELMEHVYKSLKGRIYLIIMDDMWSREPWDVLGRIFPDDNNGSRIVITTRLTDVADRVSSSPIHQMHFLNEDQSWNLLREKVFAEQSCPPELEKIGRIIAKKCGGLPLAIAVVAGILTKVDRAKNHWKRIAGDISSAVTSKDEHFSKILTLSYNHLPHHLKACFLYMGAFPEDYEISVSKLIMLWVAEGFLKPVESKSLEEAAEEYLEDLVKRNLVLISKKRSNGKSRFCGIHDLLRDLCIRKAQEEKFLHIYTSRRDLAKQRRRLTIPSLSHSIKNTRVLPIRSLLYFGINDRGFLSFALCLRLLRVLDMQKTYLVSFPVEITELFHLRYLSFAYDDTLTMPFVLPPAISKLHNLQTLIIRLRFGYVLPFDIWNLPQLRHLVFVWLSNFTIPLAPTIGGRFPLLENLQTLSGVANFIFTREAVHMIPNLKKLKICYIGMSEAKWSKLGLNNLVHLHHLETLNIGFPDGHTMFLYLEKCALPLNLKKLTLKGCTALSGAMSVIGSLPNLEVLKLRDFKFFEGVWEPNECEFPRLKLLLIHYSNLTCWRVESTHFPCLQHLVITCCWRLLEIPRAFGDITTLELIEADFFIKSFANSASIMLEEQRDLGNEILQVRQYFF